MCRAVSSDDNNIIARIVIAAIMSITKPTERYTIVSRARTCVWERRVVPPAPAPDISPCVGNLLYCINRVIYARFFPKLTKSLRCRNYSMISLAEILLMLSLKQLIKIQIFTGLYTPQYNIILIKKIISEYFILEVTKSLYLKNIFKC